MRMKCEVRISTRLPHNGTAHKPSNTFVSIGRKPGHKEGHIYLMLCTAKNRNGEKFMLQKNVQNIFAKFLKDGKATVRLSEPPYDISFNKADPTQLNSFLKLVQLACNGKELPNNLLSVLKPASVRQVEKPVTHLVVTKPSEYPLSFPATVEKLTIINCLLRRVSPHITSLTSLQELDMSDNQLTGLPDSFAQFTNLKVLMLTNNMFKTFPCILFTSRLKKTLCHVSLKHNLIDRLPADIVKMESLTNFVLDDNKIKVLPECIGRMRYLRFLMLSGNQLDFLPGSLMTRWFENIDFSQNPYQAVLAQSAVSSSSFSFPSLAECAARAIVKSRIHYTEEDLDIHSMEYLNRPHYCICGAVVFESSRCKLVYSMITSRVGCDNRNLPFLVYCCTKRCFESLR